jgi:2-oxoglutarate ferredoxin oxidoreductase subunit alpha
MTIPRLMQGNEACAAGAILAGCRFFAGYPITPSSDIAEYLARELPKVGGVFIQMEDEIASIAAVIGAAVGGAKAMTATSGPGFSLMQENIGYAAMTEVPDAARSEYRPANEPITRGRNASALGISWRPPHHRAGTGFGDGVL